MKLHQVISAVHLAGVKVVHDRDDDKPDKGLLFFLIKKRINIINMYFSDDLYILI